MASSTAGRSRWLGVGRVISLKTIATRSEARTHSRSGGESRGAASAARSAASGSGSAGTNSGSSTVTSSVSGRSSHRPLTPYASLIRIALSLPGLPPAGRYGARLAHG